MSGLLQLIVTIGVYLKSSSSSDCGKDFIVFILDLKGILLFNSYVPTTLLFYIPSLRFCVEPKFRKLMLEKTFFPYSISSSIGITAAISSGAKLSSLGALSLP